MVTDIHQATLDQLQEECAEVIQIISKIRRYGIDDVYEKIGKSNRERLEEELGHVAAFSHLMQARGFVRHQAVESHMTQRINKHVTQELEKRND